MSLPAALCAKGKHCILQYDHADALVVSHACRYLVCYFVLSRRLLPCPSSFSPGKFLRALQCGHCDSSVPQWTMHSPH